MFGICADCGGLDPHIGECEGKKMPDITLCKGTNCPLKERCYRYTAKPTQFSQSYFVDPPIKDGECEYFWDNGPRAA